MLNYREYNREGKLLEKGCIVVRHNTGVITFGTGDHTPTIILSNDPGRPEIFFSTERLQYKKRGKVEIGKPDVGVSLMPLLDARITISIKEKDHLPETATAKATIKRVA